MNKVTVSCLLTLTTLLGGCATTDYNCPMPEACSPVRDNYKAALSDESPNGWQVGGTDSSEKEDSEEFHWSDLKFWQSDFDALTEERNYTGSVYRVEGDDRETPIYIPPQPYRIWLEHWNDMQGQIQSGNYAYVTIEGRWIYLGQSYPIATGNDSPAGQIPPAMITPVKPTDMGFDPVPATAPKGALSDIIQPFE